MTEATVEEETAEPAEPNTHLPEGAYLSDEALGRLIREQLRAELTEELGEARPGKRPPRLKVEFFYDAETEQYGIETMLNNRPLEIVEGETLVDAILELVDPEE